MPILTIVRAKNTNYDKRAKRPLPGPFRQSEYRGALIEGIRIRKKGKKTKNGLCRTNRAKKQELYEGKKKNGVVSHNVIGALSERDAIGISSYAELRELATRESIYGNINE
jgi:hypothetical protein